MWQGEIWQGSIIRVYKAGIHRGEEPFIEGNERSGLITFSGCHLSCHFCYTPETSVLWEGLDYSPDAFIDLIHRLRDCGARNLNLISPTHLWHAIERTLNQMKRATPGLPFLYKISGYEGRGLIRRMEPTCDVWVPDFKVLAKEGARSVGLPGGYGAVAAKAIEQMLVTHGNPQWSADGKLRRGIVVRHLLQPGFHSDSHAVIRQLATLGFSGCLNLMTRYFDVRSKRIVRAPTQEIASLHAHAEALGIPVWIDGHHSIPATTKGEIAC